MDALPVSEQTGAEYASETPGVMHACGHDGHVAAGLTVARLLNERKENLRGVVKFVFQPAEEGLGGAERMLKEGVLENPRPDLSLALHLWNEKPVGWIGLVPGPLMAGGEIFKIRLTGVGGHGALPQETVDPVVAAAQVITALQTIASRNIHPLKAAVVSVTQVQAGEAFNVIPPTAELKGTIRTFEPDVREKVLKRFHEIVEGIGQSLGCRVEIDLRVLTPAVINDPQVTLELQTLAARDFPELHVDSSFQTMVSEDMAYLMQAVPGSYFMVGSANPDKGLNFGHHHPRFDFDESALPVAAGFMAAAAARLLETGPNKVGGTLPMPPSRVVSLVPSLTESLFDLGLGRSVVGVTAYCIHPAEGVRGLPRVGGPQAPDLDAILALQPDLVLAGREENPRQAVEALQQAGVPVRVVHPRTVRGALDCLWELAGLFQSETARLRLQALERSLDWTRAAMQGVTPWRYFCPVWMETDALAGRWWMTFNQDTYSADLLELFGGINVFSDRQRRYPLAADLGMGEAEDAQEKDVRYPRVTGSEIQAAEPQVILLPDEPFPFGDPHTKLIQDLFQDSDTGLRPPRDPPGRQPDHLVWHPAGQGVIRAARASGSIARSDRKTGYPTA